MDRSISIPSHHHRLASESRVPEVLSRPYFVAPNTYPSDPVSNPHRARISSRCPGWQNHHDELYNDKDKTTANTHSHGSFKNDDDDDDRVTVSFFQTHSLGASFTVY